MQFVWTAAAWMFVLYALYYFPYSSDGVVGRVLDGYLRVLTRAAGLIVHAFDGGVQVTGTAIVGRMPLQVVKACSSLDAQALYVAAVLAFPARAGLKLAGIVGGVFALTICNASRIAGLYFIGADAPNWFDTAHEELMPLALVILAVSGFGVWAKFASRAARI